MCVFHADLEYKLCDIENLVGVARAYPDALVMGSRSHGARSERNLRRVYEGSGPLYWTARLGGVSVTALLSLRLGRMVSDSFCGLFAAQKKVLEDCLDGRGGVDSNVRMLLRTKQYGYQIVEAGVGYSPRTRQAGKKTGFADGLKALASAFMPINLVSPKSQDRGSL